MTNRIALPLIVVHYTLPGGSTVSHPLSEPDAHFFDTSGKEVAEQYAKVLQKEKIDEHDYSCLIYNEEDRPHEIASLQLTVPGADRMAMTVPYVRVEKDERTLRGTIPHLGISATAPDAEELERRLSRMSSLSMERMVSDEHIPNRILSRVWNRMKLEARTIDLTIRKSSFSRDQENGPVYLQRCAERLPRRPSISYYDEATTERVTGLLNAEVAQSVLLVGGRGWGKTALVESIATRLHKRTYSGIWSTTASRLLTGLSEAFCSWQGNLPVLVGELSTSPDRILHVHSLRALFETGRAEGSDTTLGNELRRYLADGRIRIIAETTRAELDAVQDRWGDVQSLFRIVELREPNREELLAILIRQLERRRDILHEPAALTTLLDLQQRFLPYAGYPGTPVRFLERLIAHKEGEAVLLGPEEVREQFLRETGLPHWIVDPNVTLDETELRERLNREIFGHQGAVSAVVEGIKRTKTNLADSGRPIMNYLFVGPTGVGKTELARQLARIVFGDPERMIRFDMSEYKTDYDVAQLHKTSTGGRLTDAVRARPFSVVLFDEIEKAHPDFRYLLLQILDSGRLTDGRQRTVNFGGTIIVMTSNLGAGTADRRRVGFRAQTEDETAHNYRQALAGYFPPEIVGRFDEVVVFRSLDPESVRRVVDRELRYLNTWPGLQERTASFEVSEAARDLLARRGYDPKMGARQLQRTLRQLLLVPLARAIAERDDRRGEDRYHIRIDREGESLRCELTGPELDEFGMLDVLGRFTDLKYLEEQRLTTDRLVNGRAGQEMQDLLIRLQQLQKQDAGKFAKTGNRSYLLKNLRELRTAIEKIYKDTKALEWVLLLDRMHLAPLPIDYRQQMEQLDFRKKSWLFKLYELKTSDAENPHMATLAAYGRGAELAVAFFVEWFHREEWQVGERTVLLLPNFLNKNENTKEDIEANLTVMRYTDETELIGLSDEEGGQFVAGVELTIRGAFCRRQIEYFVRRTAMGKMLYDRPADKTRYQIHLVTEPEFFLREQPAYAYFGKQDGFNKRPTLTELLRGKFKFTGIGIEDKAEERSDLVELFAQKQRDELLRHVVEQPSWILPKILMIGRQL